LLNWFEFMSAFLETNNLPLKADEIIKLVQKIKEPNYDVCKPCISIKFITYKGVDWPLTLRFQKHFHSMKVMSSALTIFSYC
jgi:hypothetical protein